MENPPVYDGYVVGSDQTWNPFVANSPEAFFLPFVENKSKKGSYDPSLAVKSLSDEKEKEYRKKLSNFSFLSCREQDGAQLLSRITQNDFFREKMIYEQRKNRYAYLYDRGWSDKS